MAALRVFCRLPTDPISSSCSFLSPPRVTGTCSWPWPRHWLIAATRCDPTVVAMFQGIAANTATFLTSVFHPQVVMVTNHPAIATHVNIQEIYHGLTDVNLTDMFNRGKEMSGALAHFQYFLPTMARNLYNVPSVKHLYETRKDFDLIIVNHMFNEVVSEPRISGETKTSSIR